MKDYLVVIYLINNYNNKFCSKCKITVEMYRDKCPECYGNIIVNEKSQMAKKLRKNTYKLEREEINTPFLENIDSTIGRLMMKFLLLGLFLFLFYFLFYLLFRYSNSSIVSLNFTIKLFRTYYRVFVYNPKNYCQN
ncbi:MAG: hypothetical protein HeimC3_20470 [Candidatus Heimdallarchaeota archaeon LC_3]|nr:MAG: hypothetical protein HeimC3_20470 [Candidatus Heimdallarchaeota archaeon LC_3]